MLDILVVDDDEMVREPIAEALLGAGHRVTQASDGEAALSLVQARSFDLAVCDVQMPRLDGLTLLRRLRREAPETAVVMMTAYGRVPDVVGSMQDGALDYVTKPFDPDEFVRNVVVPIEERRALRKRFDRARADLVGRQGQGPMIGMSRGMRALAERTSLVAASDCSVLVAGERGTGKKLLARTLHAASLRREGPLVVVPCRSLPDRMLESELDDLSHAEGYRDAWFRAARGGTLVLDRVDVLPVAAQASLLRVLQEPGARAERGADWKALGVRLVATTAQKLHALVSTGAFLESLFFRLNEVCLTVPALSARDGDLYLLAVHILRQLTPPGSTMGRRSLTPRAWKLLSAYPFPGNVAELDAALRSAVVAAGDGDLDAEHLPATMRG